MDELDEYGYELFEQNPFPIAYLLTFRTFGTWLHGDERSSVGKNENNRYGGPTISPSVPFADAMRGQQQQVPFFLNDAMRETVSSAIKEVCDHRSYCLRALNVRTNHAHVVASGSVKPEKIVNDVKAYATRRLRRSWLVGAETKVWSRGASTRYLWKPRHVLAAVDYVLYCQEDIPFEFND